MVSRATKGFSLLLIFFLANTSLADDSLRNNIIRFEDSELRDSHLFCDDKYDLEPKRNQFNLMDYSVMGTENGERFALITIENTSHGQRIFSNEHVVAVLGNCERVAPLEFRHKMDSGEIISREIYFGYQRYPIVQLLMHTD